MRVRLFNDLSAKPEVCNLMPAGSPTAGSQMGSQRRQAVTDAGRRPATIGAGRWLTRRRPATVHDGRIAPEKRKVGGSTPPLTIHYHQRISACGLRKRHCPNRLTASPWRPFQTPVPVAGQCLVHAGCTAASGCKLLAWSCSGSSCPVQPVC